MFIEAVTRYASPPPGGPCLYYESLVFTIDRPSWRRARPSDEARPNITLLAEGECPNSKSEVPKGALR